VSGGSDLGDAPQPAGQFAFLEVVHLGQIPALGQVLDESAGEEVHREAAVFPDVVAVIRPGTVDALRCRVVAGAANNQLLDRSMGDALHARGIVYAPDFVINAGGVINIAEELGRTYDPDRARRSVERIADTLAAVFARARRDTVPPHVAADRLAEERIAAARATRPDPVAALYRPA